jgi:hypothetical protein
MSMSFMPMEFVTGSAAWPTEYTEDTERMRGMRKRRLGLMVVL